MSLRFLRPLSCNAIILTDYPLPGKKEYKSRVLTRTITKNKNKQKAWLYSNFTFSKWGGNNKCWLHVDQIKLLPALVNKSFGASFKYQKQNSIFIPILESTYSQTFNTGQKGTFVTIKHSSGTAEKVRSVSTSTCPQREKNERTTRHTNCFPSPGLFIPGWVFYWQGTLPEAGQGQRRLICLLTLMPPARSNRVYLLERRNRVPRPSNSQ